MDCVCVGVSAVSGADDAEAGWRGGELRTFGSGKTNDLNIRVVGLSVGYHFECIMTMVCKVEKVILEVKSDVGEKSEGIQSLDFQPLVWE